MDQATIVTALVEEPTILAAANRLGLPVSALARLLLDKGLKTELDAQTKALYHESIRRLQRAVDPARDLLQRALSTDLPKESIDAARALISAAQKAAEHFLMDAAITELEEQLAADSRESPEEPAGCSPPSNRGPDEESDEDRRPIP